MNQLNGGIVSNLNIANDEVHVWSAKLNVRIECAQRLAEYLSPDECARAERFHFEQDRRRFLVSRAVLRTLLSLYMRTDPHLLRFSYGPRGKPALDKGQQRYSLNFNLAHSQELVLIAITKEYQVGVDLEFVRPISDTENMAKHVFSMIEFETLVRMPREQRSEAFLKCWTCKEAYVKAIGDGLFIPLDSFDVGFEPDQPVRILAVDGDLTEASHWSLYHLKPAPHYVAALAVRRQGCQLKHWTLDIERLVIG